jgi:hypothetical protein
VGKKASTLDYRTLKSDKEVRPYDPKNKKQKKITDEQNPVSLYILFHCITNKQKN